MRQEQKIEENISERSDAKALTSPAQLCFTVAP